jgi:glycosyltransferase involved in cell wall biosynthesis
MNVLVLCHEYPPIGGGAGAVGASLAARYASRGHTVRVATMALGRHSGEETMDGVRVARIGCGRRRREMASPVEALRWAWRCRGVVDRWHREEAIDVAHAHFLMPAGIVAGGMKERFGTPTLVTLHGSDVPGFNRERLKAAHVIARPWWRRVCRSMDQVVTPSHSLAGLFREAGGVGTPEVIPNGIDAGRFRPLDKKTRILLCSRLVERKGFHYFLEAIRDLDMPGWEVDVVGDGPMRQSLEEMARHCRVPVRMHGWLDNDSDELAQLYREAMVFALPSEWENFSVALLEAMDAACAVITTDVSGNPEVVGDSGCLVPPRDVDGLREAVVRLTGSTERCLEMGARARDRVAREFDWGTVADRYLGRLSGLVAERQG